MKCLFFVVSFLILQNGVSFSSAYWPMDIPATYTYVNEAGDLLEVVIDPSGSRVEKYFTDSGVLIVSSLVSEDWGWDIYLDFSEGYWEASIDDPEYAFSFDPGLKIFDLPFWVGKTWESESQATGLVDPCSSVFFFEVIGETEIVTPGGTFSGFEILETNISINCPENPISGLYVLNEIIGPLVLPGGYTLLDFDGVISSEAVNWGAVKALYR